MLINYLSAVVKARHLLSFDYDDKPRIVEPHALGLNAKGEVVCRAWQTNGDRPGWRMFVLEKATVIMVLDTPASQAPRPGYKANDSAMTEIFAQLDEPQAVAA